jgi:hypothetical protein
MPRLIKLYIVNVAIGFALSALFLGMLLAFDLGGLRHLILETPSGWIAAMMIFMGNGIVFAGVQFAIAVMGMAEKDQGPRGGLRAPALVPVKVEARAIVKGQRRR